MTTPNGEDARGLRDRLPTTWTLLLLGIFALAAVLRLAALPAEFWFDEIWSWEFARSAGSAWDIFAGPNHHHDNNHKLNTLFLYFWPDGVRWTWYRLHSFVAGVLAVGLGALVAGQRGRAEAVLAGLLLATNYWLVLCSAEARGYALAVCFALLAFYALHRYLTRGGGRFLALFWASACLGLLSHLTFVHCYLALFLWTVYYFGRQRGSTAEEVLQLARCHAVPCLFFCGLYLVDIRGMELGGGPPASTVEVLGRLIGMGLGGPPASPVTLPLVLFAAVMVAYGLGVAARDRAHLGVFFAVAILGSPALFLVKNPPFVFERYFLISFVFFLLLLSFILGPIYRGSRAGKVLVAVVMLFICVGSVWQVRAFTHGGRGRFLDLLGYLDRETPGTVVTVAGDYDFRVTKFRDFYLPYLHSSKEFVYHRQDALPPQGARWLLVHRLDDSHPPAPVIEDARGNAYERVQDYRVATFGGWDWYVYRNVKAGHELDQVQTAGAGRCRGLATETYPGPGP